MSAIRILLVDDHPVVLGGLRDMLERYQDIEIAGQAASGEEALRLAESLHPDVVLLDLELPDMHGAQAAQLMRERSSKIKILALSAHDDPTFVRALLELGASGYVMKGETPEVIVEAIRGVAGGELRWIGQRVTSQVVSLMQKGDSDRGNLTPREREVLRLVVAGKTNLAIATDMKISQKTVEKYMGTIFTKLNVTSRVEAAVYAVREGLIGPG